MPSKPQMVVLSGNRTYQIDVIGESQYRSNIRAVVGHELDVFAVAHLVPEPTKHADPDAIRVDINGKPVGYLPKQTATQLAATLRRLGLAGVELQAHISAAAGSSSYSIWLDGDLDEIGHVTTGDRPWWRFW